MPTKGCADKTGQSRAHSPRKRGWRACVRESAAASATQRPSRSSNFLERPRGGVMLSLTPQRHLPSGAKSHKPGNEWQHTSTPRVTVRGGGPKTQPPWLLSSEQGSGTGAAHFLLRPCEPQAGPSGNEETSEESPAARAGFGASHEGRRRGRARTQRARSQCPTKILSPSPLFSPRALGEAAGVGASGGRGARRRGR